MTDVMGLFPPKVKMVKRIMWHPSNCSCHVCIEYWAQNPDDWKSRYTKEELGKLAK